METPPLLPQVLVLLATYNGAQWLPDQLESILSQTGVQVRILVGDDNSSDSTVHLLRSRWGADPRISIVARGKGSGSAGANFRQLYSEADLTGAEYVALADQDDIWPSDKLSVAVTQLNASRAGGYSCAVRAFWPDGREKTLAQDPGTTVADYLFEGAGQGCTFVLTAQLFARVQKLCTAHPEVVADLHYHDWLIYLLSRAWNCTWVFDRQPHLHYRQHANNEIGARGGLAGITRRLSMIRNGWYRNQVLAALAVYRAAGGADPIALRMHDLLDRNGSPGRNVRLACYVLRHGRRSMPDRAILCIAVLMNWL